MHQINIYKADYSNTNYELFIIISVTLFMSYNERAIDEFKFGIMIGYE